MDSTAAKEQLREKLERLEDIVRAAQHKYDRRFSMFLDAETVMYAKTHLRTEEAFSAVFYGGYDGAERCMLGIWPAYEDNALSESFPIALLRIDCPAYKALTHRDCLGSLLGLGIKRECIGDILCDAQTFYAFVSANMCAYILENLHKIGSMGVQVRQIPVSSFCAPPQQTKTKGIFVMSNRLDAVLAGALDVSRSRAAELIALERVSVNHSLQTETSFKLHEGDLLSVRGFGRLRVGCFGNQSRKGRTYLELIVYL